MTAWPDPARPGVPLNPEQEGLHWLRYEHDGYVEVSAFLWERDGYWVKSRHVHYSEWPGRWTYLSPCLLPDEAEALQKRADQAALGHAREAARADQIEFLHKRGVAALQARVAELEGALRPFAELGRFVVEHHPDPETDLNHEMSALVRHFRNAHAALEGKKDE